MSFEGWEWVGLSCAVGAVVGLRECRDLGIYQGGYVIMLW